MTSLITLLLIKQQLQTSIRETTSIFCACVNQHLYIWQPFYFSVCASCLSLHAKGYSEHQVVYIQKSLKTAVNKNKIKQQTLETLNRLAEGENDSTDWDDRKLLQMSLNICRMTSKRMAYKKNGKWQQGLSALKRCFKKRLFLKLCTAEKSLFINKKQRRARLKLA